MAADQINVSITADRQTARLTVKSEKGAGDIVQFNATDIEKLIKLLAESRVQMLPQRVQAAQAGEKIELTIGPNFSVGPRQTEGPLKDTALLIVGDAKYGLLSYAFTAEQWDRVDSGFRKGLATRKAQKKKS